MLSHTWKTTTGSQAEGPCAFADAHLDPQTENHSATEKFKSYYTNRKRNYTYSEASLPEWCAKERHWHAFQHQFVNMAFNLQSSCAFITSGYASLWPSPSLHGTAWFLETWTDGEQEPFFLPCVSESCDLTSRASVTWCCCWMVYICLCLFVWLIDLLCYFKGGEKKKVKWYQQGCGYFNFDMKKNQVTSLVVLFELLPICGGDGHPNVLFKRVDWLICSPSTMLCVHVICTHMYKTYQIIKINK